MRTDLDLYGYRSDGQQARHRTAPGTPEGGLRAMQRMRARYWCPSGCGMQRVVNVVSEPRMPGTRCTTSSSNADIRAQQH